MHELSIAQNIVEIVSHKAENRPIVRVKVAIGKLTAVSPEALLFCFDECTKDTVLERATLQIDLIDAHGKCNDCSQEMLLNEPPWICSCGCSKVRCISGMELDIREMEIA